MPWATAPAAVRKRYSSRCAAVWVEVANKELSRHGDEGRAIRIANTAANRCKAAGKAMLNEPKAVLPIKAQLMDDEELEAWFTGRTSRRLLAIPFGGPIPSAKSAIGVDIDGDWFSERTDIYGPFPELRQTRDRLVDFHHSYRPPTSRQGDPTGMMNGAILGKSVIDPEPDEDGWWADVWLKHGERRLNLIKALVKRGGQLFGSSQRVPGDTLRQDPVTGEILQWPHLLQTISTSPQNTFSRFATAKATLDELDSAEVPVDQALRDFLTDLDNLGADLPLTSYLDGDSGDAAAKAGRVLSARNERALRDALALIARHLDEMAGAPTESPTEGDASEP
jgi:hypothetical protein